MPVKTYKLEGPPANVQFEQPQGPVVVGDPDLDPNQSTGFLEHNPGDQTATADWHDQSNVSVQFEQPGPQTVELEGFRQKSQAKVVDPAPAKKAPAKTTGARKK